MSLSKSQLDQLGERIRGGEISEADLQLLDSYRRSFAPAYEHVVGVIRDQLGSEPTGRPTKSTTSIVDKLARESIRLTQMQDIAGCRIVVPGVLQQDGLVAGLTGMFSVRSVFDRRKSPSSGYRAVHVIVRHLERPIEIQVRTTLQHVWAEVSEKLSDLVGPSVKYGAGPSDLTAILLMASANVALIEELERRLSGLTNREDQAGQIAELAKTAMEEKTSLAETLRDMVRHAHIWTDN